MMNQFKGKKILVVGDIMIDKYIFGEYKKKSPEADADLIVTQSQDYKLGGAANIAVSLANLGNEIELIGVYGDDYNQGVLKELISVHNNIEDKSVVEKQRKTTIKTRIYRNGEYLLRLDNESDYDISKEIENVVLEMVGEVLDIHAVEGIVLQDYNKGLLTSNLIKQIIKRANKKGVKVFVDPKIKNWNAYKNAFLFKPNRDELIKSMGLRSTDLPSLKDAGASFAEDNNIRYFVLTLSQEGILVYHKKEWKHYPSIYIESPDVCGAGDGVISVLTYAMLNSFEIGEACQMANKIGAIICETKGVRPLLVDDITQIMQ